jgi:hypothetical protein
MERKDDESEATKGILAEIRRAILEDIKAMGRRMSVDEALARYGRYGVEASEVIAAMAEQGLLSRASGAYAASGQPGDPGSDRLGSFDAEALGRNIGAAVQGFIDEIERSAWRAKERERRQSEGRSQKRFADAYAGKYARHFARQLRDERREEHRAMRDALRHKFEDGETGKWDRKLMDDDEWKPGAEELEGDFALYREGLEARCRKRRAGLVGNLISFLCINGLLWFINLTTSRDFLWAAIVSAAWGIGVVSSFVAASRAGTKLREIDAMPDLDSDQLEIYKKLNRMKDSLAQHGASTIMVPFLLGVINYLASPTVPWAIIPSAAMVVGYISHVAAYASSKPRLERKFFESLGTRGGWRDLFRRGKTRRADEAGLGPYAGLYREAEGVERAIEEQLSRGGAGPFDADLAPSLRQYLDQIRLLAKSANEIDRIVEAIPMDGLEKDKENLLARASTASSEQLKAEYSASIAEIESQEHSYQKLKEQREVLRLRLGSSVNQLKRMRIDIARLKATPGAGDLAAGSGDDSSLGQIRQRTDELARYLEDLRQGYAESVADPFAALAEREELERAEAARQALSDGRQPPRAPDDAANGGEDKKR